MGKAPVSAGEGRAGEATPGWAGEKGRIGHLLILQPVTQQSSDGMRLLQRRLMSTLFDDRKFGLRDRAGDRFMFCKRKGGVLAPVDDDRGTGDAAQARHIVLVLERRHGL